MGTKDPVLAPYQTYRTKDGHLNVACLNQKLWREFCAAIERPELPEDERFETNADRVEHMDALEVEIEGALTEKTTDEWMQILAEDAGIPAGPVQSFEDALYNEQTEARGVVTEIEARGQTIPVIEHPINYRESESGFTAPPPELGKHNREVLEELEYSEAEIDAMEAGGVFGGAITATRSRLPSIHRLNPSGRSRLPSIHRLNPSGRCTAAGQHGLGT